MHDLRPVLIHDDFEEASCLEVESLGIILVSKGGKLLVIDSDDYQEIDAIPLHMWHPEGEHKH